MEVHEVAVAVVQLLFMATMTTLLYSTAHNELTILQSHAPLTHTHTHDGQNLVFVFFFFFGKYPQSTMVCGRHCIFGINLKSFDSMTRYAMHI